MSGPEFYHGTRTEIHTGDTPFLDPERAARIVTGADGTSRVTYKKDPDDPDLPHVYVSDDKLASELFALQTDTKQHTCGSFDGKFPHAIYQSEPEFGGRGYLYTIPQEDYQPFERRANGKYVSYEKIHLSAENCQPIAPRDLFVRPDPVQIFYFTDKIDIGEFSSGYRKAAEQGMEATQNFLNSKVKTGGLLVYDHLGSKPYSALKKDATSQAETRKAPVPTVTSAPGAILTPEA